MEPEEGREAGFKFTGRIDNSMLDVVLDSLLQAVPAPHVVAIDPSGFFIDMPACVPVRPEQIIRGPKSALDLCVPGDFKAIVAAFYGMREQGSACTPVHLLSLPERELMLHFTDATYRYGAILGVLVGASEKAVFDAAAMPAVIRPRLCNVERSALSIITAADTATSQILGWSAAELVGRHSVELTHPDEMTMALANWLDMLGHPGGEHRVQLRYRHREGHYIWFEVTNRNLLNDPERPRVQSQLLDISDRMEALEALRASEELLRRLTEALPLGILQIDAECRIVYHNERLNEIVDAPGATTLDDQLHAVAADDRQTLKTALATLLEFGQPADLDLTVERTDGNRRCSVGMRPLRFGPAAVSGAIICVADITERLRMAQELEHRAKYDQLTDCHNRAAILEKLESVVKAPGSAAGMAVLFIDLDRFKAVNDTFGHAAGDELLKRTAQRLRNSVRDIDTVGRLGGDEFLIVCPEVASPDEALRIARRVAAALSEPVIIGSSWIEPGSSIGVAWTSERIESRTLVASADAAMYESKRGSHVPVLSLARLTAAQPA